MHSIISIHPKHAREIASGTKTIEVRTRSVNLPAGSYLWVYSTLPVGAIHVVATVVETYRLAPNRAWKTYEQRMQLTKSEFRSYVNGSSLVSLIRFGDIIELKEPVSLASMRGVQKKFHPPQFLRTVKRDERIYELFFKTAPQLFLAE
jgi:predicted transcriptional regulator